MTVPPNGATCSISLSAVASRISTMTSDEPGVSDSASLRAKSSSTPISLSEPAKAPLAAPMAAPTNGIKNSMPKSRPQNAPPSAPAPTRLCV